MTDFALPATVPLKDAASPKLDIFCRVIDNFGDIGTSWRLALQMHKTYGYQVRLWVDELAALKQLVPQVAEVAQQTLSDIGICHWQAQTVRQFSSADIADAVIEMFACDLPPAYIAAMLQRHPHPVWINLEYFSCESWVSGCHGLASLQHNGLSKWFFFPGIREQSGGLLREQEYFVRQADFQEAEREAWLLRNAIPPARGDSIKIALFAYENQALNSLLDWLQRQSINVDLYLPQGRLVDSLSADWRAHMARQSAEDKLQLHLIAFLPQSDYDALLWYCDVNFVRGEESLSRAIWAAKPFVWHIYATADQAHWPKLEAFIEAFEMPKSVANLTREWNREALTEATLQQVFLNLDALQKSANAATERLAKQKSLAEQLNFFMKNRAEVL